MKTWGYAQGRRHTRSHSCRSESFFLCLYGQTRLLEMGSQRNSHHALKVHTDHTDADAVVSSKTNLMNPIALVSE